MSEIHPPQVSPTASRRTYLLAGTGVLLAGLAFRLGLAALAPQWAYVADHYDNIGMGMAADEFGLLRVYSADPKSNPVVTGQVCWFLDGKFERYDRQMPRVTNYPPLGVLIFYLQTKGLYAIAPDVWANTFFARAWMSLPAVAADLVLAVGMFLLVRELAGPRAGAIAAAVTWMLPPVAMDSAFWGQVDSFFLAPAVLVLWLMFRNRWAAAGVAAAVATMLKPQGALLAPIVLFAAAVLGGPDGRRSLKLTGLRLAAVVPAGLISVLVLSAPWTIADGLSWLHRAFLDNFALYAGTTLSAFNLWYVDALMGENKYALDLLNSSVVIGGLSKDAWGRVLLLISMAALAALCWWRLRQRPKLAATLFAGMFLWSAFLWPTRVHERYIMYAIAPMLAAAVPLRRLRLPFAALALLATTELCAYIWTRPMPVGRFNMGTVGSYYQAMSRDPRARVTLDDALNVAWEDYDRKREQVRPREYAATLVSLGAYGWAIAAAFFLPGTSGGAEGGPAAPRPQQAPAGARPKDRPDKRRRQRR